MRNQAKWLKLTVLLFLVAAPQEAYLQGEYGDSCSSNADCASKDFRNPLICIPVNILPPTEPPIHTTEEPISTAEEFTTNTKEFRANIEEFAPSSETTTEEFTATTEKFTATTEEFTANTEEFTATTEKFTATTEEFTATTEEFTTPTEEFTTPTEEFTTPNEEFTTPNEGFTTPNEEFTTPTEEIKTTTEDSGHSGVCGCEPSMIRHAEFNRCVSPPMGHCHQQPENGKQKTCTKFAQCYPQSPDNNAGICYCDDGTVEVPSLECKLIYGSECEKPSDCNIYSDLTCNNGTCACKFEGSQQWSEEHNTCANVPGASCRKSPPLPDPICVKNATCIDDICECDAGFIRTPENECKRDYNQTCTGDSDCIPPFTCSESLCLCPDNRLYFESTKLCHLPAGSPCNSSSSSDICTLASTCLSETCSCNDGYESATDGSCNALYDSSCSAELPCHPGKFLGECPASSGSSNCGCRANYNYNVISKRCVGNIDEECSVNEDCAREVTVCRLDKCACDGNLLPGKDKQSCYAGYGGYCANDACHPDLNLKCGESTEDGNSVSFICLCDLPNDQTYDAIRGDCVALAGKSCDVSSVEKNINCVENAECNMQNNGQSVCICHNGYGADRTGHCVQGNGSSVMVSPIEKTYLYILLTFFFLLKHII